MKKPLKSMTIHASFVTDFGTRGKCVNCVNASEFTAEIDSKIYCKSCGSRKFTKSSVKYEKTDAIFACPASISGKQRCSVTELTYDEYYVGSCCENAAQWTYKTGKLFRQKTVQLIYENARKDEDTAETRLENADKKVAEARNLLEKATQNQINSDRSLGEKKKWRKTVQKRALFLANEAMKEDNSDLEADETDEKEIENRKKRKMDDEEADKLTCKVCLEKYDNEHIEATIIPCGHKSCFQCLSSLPRKNCPTCRARFTKRNLYKLY